jgi:hypothetical protein
MLVAFNGQKSYDRPVETVSNTLGYSYPISNAPFKRQPFENQGTFACTDGLDNLRTVVVFCMKSAISKLELPSAFKKLLKKVKAKRLQGKYIAIFILFVAAMSVGTYQYRLLHFQSTVNTPTDTSGARIHVVTDPGTGLGIVETPNSMSDQGTTSDQSTQSTQTNNPPASKKTSPQPSADPGKFQDNYNAILKELDRCNKANSAAGDKYGTSISQARAAYDVVIARWNAVKDNPPQTHPPYSEYAAQAKSNFNAISIPAYNEYVSTFNSLKEQGCQYIVQTYRDESWK